MTVHRPQPAFLVRPFARRREGAEVVIGDLGRQVFLAVPPEAVDILDALAAGDTVDEIADRHERRHGERLDIEGFLDVMVAEGFVVPAGADDAGSAVAPVQGHGHGTPTRNISLDWISPAVARRLASWPVVTALLAMIAGGVALVLPDPDVLPGSSTLLFPHGHFAAFTLVVFAAMMAATFLHELAHAVVARAAGVPVSLGIGNLMYSLAAQTDVSGLRLAPKRQRYLAFAAGAIVDLASAAVLVGVVWMDRHGWVHLPVHARDLLGAILFAYLVRASFQLLFYMRTDIYYVLATAFGAKNLLADTEVALRNLVRRLVGRRRRVEDRSGLTPRERVAVWFYSVVYLGGRAIAFSMLFTLFLPLTLAILEQFFLVAIGRPSRFGVLDLVVAGTLVLLVDGGGIVLWVRELIRNYRRRRAAAASARSSVLPPGRDEVLAAA